MEEILHGHLHRRRHVELLVSVLGQQSLLVVNLVPHALSVHQRERRLLSRTIHVVNTGHRVGPYASSVPGIA
eukprot:116273-Rhodomonas_salina.4